MARIKESLLLVDGNNILQRAYHIPGFQKLETTNGLRIGALYGFLRAIFNIADANPRFRMVVCWDGGRCPRRMSLKASYKDRPKKEDTTGQMPVYDQISLAEEVLADMGIASFRFPQVEADDIIAVLSLNSQSSIIYSNDKDFAQLIRPGHRLVRTAKREDEYLRYDNYRIRSKHELDPLEFRLFLSISGDKIDGVPGVSGLGDKSAIALLKASREKPYASKMLDPVNGDPSLLQGVAQEILDAKVPRMGRLKYLKEKWPEFLQSLALVDLWRKDLLSEELIEKCIARCNEKRPFNREGLEDRFDEYDFLLDLDSIEDYCNGVEDEDAEDIWDSIF
jgi:DNA polymerase-1